MKPTDKVKKMSFNEKIDIFDRINYENRIKGEGFYTCMSEVEEILDECGSVREAIKMIKKLKFIKKENIKL